LTPQQQSERGESLYGQGHELLLSLGDDIRISDAGNREVLLRALALLQEAEEYGHDQAALELALLYDQTKDNDILGLGPEKYPARYRYYLERAEAAGLPLARELLGLNYLEGANGYNRDIDKALKLLEEAAEAGSLRAQRALAGFYYGDIDVYLERYIYWCEKIADAGDGLIQACLGYNFQYGYYSFPQSYEKAIYWYEKAAANNSDLGLHYLGHLYLLGQGVAVDYAKARELFTKAAELEDWGGAAHHLGEIYYNGLGVKRDYREAFKWFTRGAEGGTRGGYYGSMYMLAYMHYKGQGVRAGAGNAKTWYDLALAAEYHDGYAESKYMKPAIAYLRKIFNK
jgi:TPR repeat protein